MKSNYFHIICSSASRLLIFISVFVFSFSVVAQEINPNGYTIFYHPNGKVSSEGTMRSGKPDGYWKTYYENGQLKSEGNRLNFKLDSLWRFYSDSGVVTAEYNYTGGIKNGLQRNYYPNGKLRTAETDSMGIRVGTSQFYDERGNRIKSIPYTNGVENGMAREYNSEDLLITVAFYRNGFFQREEKINRLDKSGRKQGIYRTYYDSDQLKSEGAYTDDLKDGLFKEYAEDGRVMKKEEYRMGELIPDEKEEQEKFEVKRNYFPDGSVRIVGTYKKGMPEGIFRQYDREGNLDSAKVFAAGRLLRQGKIDNQGREQGEWKEFYESGKLKAIGNYTDGKKDGLWKHTFENDSLEQIGVFVKGKPEGLWKWYYPSGVVRREETYKNGKENGIMREYDDQGAILAEGEYINGLQEGEWSYSIDEYVARGKFIEGREDGLWKQFYTGGQIAFEGEFLDGQETGEHRYYWPDGKMREVRVYRLGLPDGQWKLYDENGALLVTITYRNGEELKVDQEELPRGEPDDQ